jgi:hypothetical protein
MCVNSKSSPLTGRAGRERSEAGTRLAQSREGVAANTLPQQLERLPPPDRHAAKLNWFVRVNEGE